MSLLSMPDHPICSGSSPDSRTMFQPGTGLSGPVTATDTTSGSSQASGICHFKLWTCCSLSLCHPISHSLRYLSPLGNLSLFRQFWAYSYNPSRQPSHLFKRDCFEHPTSSAVRQRGSPPTHRILKFKTALLRNPPVAAISSICATIAFAWIALSIAH